MVWQDFVLFAAQAVFVVALFPSIFSKDKPHLVTCALTAGPMGLITTSFFTLGLYFGGVLAAVLTVMWSILLWQRLKIFWGWGS